MLELADIQKRLGLTRGQVNHYVVTGLISGAGKKVGTGRARKFTRMNLLEFAIVKRLVEHGFQFSEVREILIHLRKAYPPLQSEKFWKQVGSSETLAVVNRRFAHVVSFEEIDVGRLLRQGARRHLRFEAITLINLDAELRAVTA